MKFHNPSAIISIIEVGVGGGILRVRGDDEAVRYEGDAVKHGFGLRDEVFPGFWIADRCDHQLVHGGVHVSEKVDEVAVGLYGNNGVFHVLSDLHEGGIGLS